MGGDGSWTSKDDVLTLALTAYEDGLCKQCGHPLELCRDGETDGWWEVGEAVCQATRATELWRRGQSKDWQPDAGQLIYAKPPSSAGGAGADDSSDKGQDDAKH